MSRHNAVGGILHQTICLEKGLVNEEKPYYTYEPEPVLENENIKFYWDTCLTTNRRIQHKPDILILYKKEKRASVIDFTRPLDENIRKARTEKMVKYQELCQKLKRMYGLAKAEVFPVVISSNDTRQATQSESSAS